MILNLHYRTRREFSKPVYFLLDFLDKIPLLGSLLKIIVKRYDYESYQLTLNLDKIKTEMFLKNNNPNVISEMSFSDLKEVSYDFNRKYESFSLFPTVATFYSKSTSSIINVPISKKSDYLKLRKELSSMGVIQKSRIKTKIIALVLGTVLIAVLASYFLGPYLLDLVFNFVQEN